MNSSMTRVLNRINISLGILLLAPSLYACDVCGCFMGLTPYDNQSHAGMLYRLRTFSGYYGMNPSRKLFPSGSLRINPSAQHSGHTHGQTLQPDDYEEYRILEFRARFFVHPRIEMNLILPVHFNSMRMHQTVHRVSGIGDVNFYSGYQLLRKNDMETWQYRLTVGAGIKLPAGSHTRTDNHGQRFHLMMQPGTGTTDFFLYGHSTILLNRSGFSLAGAFKWNGTNDLKEKVSNSVTIHGSLFYKTFIGGQVIIPAVHYYYEHTAGIITDEGINQQSSMNVLMAGPGVDLYVGNFQFMLSGLLPIAEERIHGKAVSAFKMAAGIIFNFNQRNYLLGKKQAEKEP
jgi:hypothetical protein